MIDKYRVEYCCWTVTVTVSRCKYFHSRSVTSLHHSRLYLASTARLAPELSRLGPSKPLRGCLQKTPPF